MKWNEGNSLEWGWWKWKWAMRNWLPLESGDIISCCCPSTGVSISWYSSLFSLIVGLSPRLRDHGDSCDCALIKPQMGSYVSVEDRRRRRSWFWSQIKDCGSVLWHFKDKSPSRGWWLRIGRWITTWRRNRNRMEGQFHRSSLRLKYSANLPTSIAPPRIVPRPP